MNLVFGFDGLIPMGETREFEVGPPMVDDKPHPWLPHRFFVPSKIGPYFVVVALGWKSNIINCGIPGEYFERSASDEPPAIDLADQFFGTVGRDEPAVIKIENISIAAMHARGALQGIYHR